MVKRAAHWNRAPVDTWTHIAVVYDPQKLSLFVNGLLQDSKPLAPSRASEWINAVVIGGDCAFPYNPKPSFKGGIRGVRIYGRNLSPAEFLFDGGDLNNDDRTLGMKERRNP